MNKKRLYKNKEEGIFTGVLSGFSAYFGIEVTLLRIFFILFVLVTGFFPGVLAYLIGVLLMPERPKIEPLNKPDYKVYEAGDND